MVDDYFAEKIAALIVKHESALMSDETDFSSELESQTSLDIGSQLQSLRKAITQLSSQVTHQVDECSAKIAEEVKKVKNANSEFHTDLQGAEEKLEDLTERISRLSEAKGVSETLTDLQNRVKEQHNKLNIFTQNVIKMTNLPQMVEDLKKRLELIEKL